jgi:hypothetical protein
MNITTVFKIASMTGSFRYILHFNLQNNRLVSFDANHFAQLIQQEQLYTNLAVLFALRTLHNISNETQYMQSLGAQTIWSTENPLQLAQKLTDRPPDCSHIWTAEIRTASIRTGFLGNHTHTIFLILYKDVAYRISVEKPH